MGAQFDLAGLKVIAQPVALVESVIQSFSLTSSYHTGAGQFSISDSGSLIYAAGGFVPDPKHLLVWVDQKGLEQPVADLAFPSVSSMRLSPDGQRIAYVARQQIWIYDLVKATNSRLTSEGWTYFVIWDPDGSHLLFSWMRALVLNLFVLPYGGSLPMKRLTTSECNQYPASWTSNGKTIAFVESHPGTTSIDIAMLGVDSGRATPFLNSRFVEQFPDFSPDGRWLAYSSNESEREEVYVQDFPSKSKKIQISSKGGNEPMWAKNGKQLYYRWQDQVWVVDVETRNGFAAGKPRLLFEKPGYAHANLVRRYDLSRDGQRFLMVKTEQKQEAPVTEMILIQNWFEELKRLVPTGKK
jgi:serine/threonine-protein kinase